LTPHVQKFTEWVGTLHAGRGGDIQEDQLTQITGEVIGEFGSARQHPV
jgi:hypothetical protein